MGAGVYGRGRRRRIMNPLTNPLTSLECDDELFTWLHALVAQLRRAELPRQGQVPAHLRLRYGGCRAKGSGHQHGIREVHNNLDG